MNIFVLDRDIKKCAEYHCDMHMSKMCIEYTQLLSTALHISESVLSGTEYKPTHVNHPCSVWVRESLAHWEWLWRLGHNLGNEYTRRYGKIHKSTRILRSLPVPTKIPDLGWLRDPPQAMPDEYKDEDVVKAYRNYYNCDKSRFAKWEKTGKVPYWYNKLTDV